MHGIGHAKGGAGVVHQDVNGVEAPLDGFHHAGNTVGAGDVQIDSQRFDRMGLSDLPGDIGHFTLIAGPDRQFRVRTQSQVGNHHVGPFGSQFTCHGITDTGAFAGTGHHGGFPAEHILPYFPLVVGMVREMVAIRNKEFVERRSIIDH